MVFPPGWTENIEETIGLPRRAVHRVDLHNTLKELALRDDRRSPRVELHLGLRIVRVDVGNVEVEMADGKIWRGDVLVGADGIHSIARKFALRKDIEMNFSEGEC